MEVDTNGGGYVFDAVWSMRLCPFFVPGIKKNLTFFKKDVL